MSVVYIFYPWKLRLFSVFSADTFGQTIKPHERCWIAFTNVSFYVSVKLGHIRNTVIERLGEILTWWQRLVEIVSN